MAHDHIMGDFMTVCEAADLFESSPDSFHYSTPCGPILSVGMRVRLRDGSTGTIIPMVEPDMWQFAVRVDGRPHEGRITTHHGVTVL